MITDMGQIVATVVAILTPFLPFLVDAGKAAEQKLAEVIAEKGGEAAWNKAQMLWGKISAHFKDDVEVNGAATMVATKPEDEARQMMLAEVLADRLRANPELATEMLKWIGGQQAVQQILAERGSWIEEVSQHITAAGSQSIIARDNSTIKIVRQDIGHGGTTE